MAGYVPESGSSELSVARWYRIIEAAKKIGIMDEKKKKSFCFFKEPMYIFLSAVENGNRVVSMLSDRSFNMQKTCPVLPRRGGENSPF